MKFSIVSRCTTGAFRYQAWPTVSKGDDGTLYAVTSGHRLGHVCPFGKNLMYVSHDEGETWSSPIIVNDTYLDDRDAGLLVWGDNMLLSWFNHPASFFDEEHPNRPFYILNTPLAEGMKAIWRELPEEKKEFGSFTKISRDGGKTWSEPRRSPVSAPHGPIRKKDGTLLYLGRLLYDNNSYIKGNIFAYESHDEGESWQYLASIPCPEGYEGKFFEPHSCELPDGTIIGGIRAHNEALPGGKLIFTLFSYDGGKTWTDPKPMKDVHGCPPHFLLHSSGALILTYGQRRLEPQGQYARISYDSGRTWEKEIMVSPKAPDWDHGYPSSVELSNGDILTVYYQKYEGDTYPSLLSTRWNISEGK